MTLCLSQAKIRVSFVRSEWTLRCSTITFAVTIFVTRGVFRFRRDTSFSLFLSFFLSNLSIRCISFTSAPIFPLSFSLSRAIESCRRISPLEGVRTEKNEQKKRVPLTRCSKRMATTFVVLRHCLSNIHDAREIINETKGYTIENFNVLIDEYYNLWMRLTRERITMPLVKIRFLQTWGLVFRSAWTSRKLDNIVIIIAFLSEERIGNHVFLAMMSS